MKSVIYVSFLDEDRLSGYKYKIHSQCNAISNLGYKTYLFIINKGEICFYNIATEKEELIFRKKINRKRLSNKRNPFDELLLFKYFIKELFLVINDVNPSYIYFRRILPITPLLLKSIKLIKRMGIEVYYEYPTFPWEKELLVEKKYIFYLIDKIQFKALNRLVSKMVVVGADEKIYSNDYTVISNAIKVNDIPQISPIDVKNLELNLIGVANVNAFHGYDRIINGLAEYYSQSPDRIIKFHIVGKIGKGLKLQELVNSLQLNKYVFFHGHKEGEELQDLFNRSQIGVGCLGVHRKNVSYLNSLKNREYAARGIPFIFSENDYSIERRKPEFIFKPSFDDSPIDINQIIEFYKKMKSTPKEIREFAMKYLNWESEMEKVFLLNKES